MFVGVSGWIVEPLDVLPFGVLLLRGKNTSPFGCEHDGLDGGLVKMFGEPIKKTQKNHLLIKNRK